MTFFHGKFFFLNCDGNLTIKRDGVISPSRKKWITWEKKLENDTIISANFPFSEKTCCSVQKKELS